MYKEIRTPLTDDTVEKLKAGDRVLISGKIYAARDAAHKRMIEGLENGGKLPFDAKGQIIYYAGPCPPKPGFVIGPFGPTTSGRMDKYSPQLLKLGLKGMIGKGDRGNDVIDAMIENKSVYFAAIGGLGAYISTVVKEFNIIAYEDLGTEALMELEVENFPVIVAIDCNGGNLYRTEPEKYSNQFDISKIKG